MAGLSIDFRFLAYLAVFAVAWAAFDWLAPPGDRLRIMVCFGGLAAVVSFLVLPRLSLSGPLGTRAAQFALSVLCAAIAALVVHLAAESRAVAMSIALYFVLWWVLLFAVLPFGVRSQHDANDVEPGSDPGAPVKPLMLRKVIATSVVAAVVLILVQLFLVFRPIPNVLPF